MADSRGTQALLDRAIRAHLSGDVATAEARYWSVLDRVPTHAVALNNLATILAGRGERDGALDLLRRAVAVDPRYGEAFNNLGLVHNERGERDAAHAAFAQAVALVPRHADWQNNYGNACIELQRYEDALRAYDAAVAERPAEPKFWSNRGIALRGLRQPDEAVAALHRALALDPSHVNALGNLGILLKEQKRFDESIDAFERAVALDGASAALVANFASVYEAMGDYDRMRALAARAVALDPAFAEGYTLLANHALEAGQYDAAESLYWKAIALDPENRNANWNLAIIWLMRGDFERGWRQFEWRKRLQSVLVDRPALAGPEWDGSPLAGRTILLAAEQGMGDAIQFIRYARDLKRRGAGRVIVECPYPVAALLAAVPGVDEVVARGLPLPPYDTHASLMSLPLLLGTTLESIPAEVPYLRPERRAIRDRIEAPAGVMKVGIVWAGNPIHPRDFHRSADLAWFLPLLDVGGTRFFSLQKGDRAEAELRHCGDVGIVDLAPELRDFMDTASAIEQLDLVIAVDTSVAHLAGALGKPTWVLLPAVADYRWLLQRTDSPWYPTMRLFRQATPGQWDAVFAEVESALRKLVSGEKDARARLPATVHPHAMASKARELPYDERRPIGIDWELRADTGWGVYGTHLAAGICDRTDVRPAIFSADAASLGAATIARLGRAFAETRALQDALRDPQVRLTIDGTMLRALGNNMAGGPLWERVRAAHNVGVIFFEDTAFDDAALERARGLDLIVTGCTWNADVLGGLGLTNVTTIFQGVDRSVFHPAPRTGRFGDRFVVFSGGKLEYRKGQDIVVAAFRRFRERHPDALLVTAWHNAWSHLIADLDLAGHVEGMPAVARGRLDIPAWLERNGIPASAVHDVGVQPNAAMGALVREADVALFPNRCEGGTNLVAMECMAAGVPTIVSHNTGHLDLVATGGCLSLAAQGTVPVPTKFYRATDGWGETSVDVAVEALEAVWRDRQAARAVAASGADVMQDWSWSRQVERLLMAIQPSRR